MEHGDHHYSAMIAVPGTVSLEWRLGLSGPPPRDVTLDYIDAGPS